ncbi:unnamed protein product [Rhodiola kirilowii]
MRALVAWRLDGQIKGGGATTWRGQKAAGQGGGGWWQPPVAGCLGWRSSSLGHLFIKSPSHLAICDELPHSILKAMAVTTLSMNLNPGIQNQNLADFYQFSLDIVALQNNITKAIWLINEKVMVSELRELQLLLGMDTNLSIKGLRSTIRKLLTVYLFECDDMDVIPKSLLDALSMFNRSSLNVPQRYFLKDDIDEDVECILDISAQAKQIILDFLPYHNYDQEFTNAYMEDLQGSSESDKSDTDDALLFGSERSPDNIFRINDSAEPAESIGDSIFIEKNVSDIDPSISGSNTLIKMGVVTDHIGATPVFLCANSKAKNTAVDDAATQKQGDDVGGMFICEVVKELLPSISNRWLMSLPTSKDEDQQIQWLAFLQNRYLPESLLREDDTSKTSVKKAFGTPSLEKENYSFQESVRDVDIPCLSKELSSRLDDISNTWLHLLAMHLTNVQNVHNKTRWKLKNIVQKYLRRMQKCEGDHHLEECVRLSQVVTNPCFFGKGKTFSFSSSYQSPSTKVQWVLGNLKNFPSQVLLSMHRKLKGESGKMIHLEIIRSGWTRNRLIHCVKKICESTLAELEEGDELPHSNIKGNGNDNFIHELKPWHSKPESCRLL